jgi:hypothetical protein
MTAQHAYRCIPPERAGPPQTTPGASFSAASDGSATALSIWPSTRPGQPRRYCSSARKVAERRRLK